MCDVFCQSISELSFGFIGDPGRTNIASKNSGLDWQTGLTASSEAKQLFSPSANRKVREGPSKRRSPTAANGRASNNDRFDGDHRHDNRATTDRQPETALSSAFARALAQKAVRA
jgi:hypothetical protein